MKVYRTLASLVLLPVLLAGCGSDNAATTTTTTTAITTTTVSSPPSTDSGPTTSSTTDNTSTTPASQSTTSTSVATAQPAIWPAPGVIFETPAAAAEDFVSKVFRVPPELGEFKQGDSRSGEIDVLSLGEGEGPAVVRSTLIMRQLAPDDGWFVLAAVNPNNTISTPEPGAEVEAGPVNVSGKGRGFEATLIVEAFLVGDGSEPISQEITQGGSGADSEPYSAIVVLVSAQPGSTVLILVRGGVGLETDPGEFSAIPVVIG